MASKAPIVAAFMDELEVISIRNSLFRFIPYKSLFFLGPATVRLVVNNGPPRPMSMQVPPGHLVQQIVDEDGILTHLILTPIPPYHQYRPIGPVESALGSSTLSRSPNSVSSTSRFPLRPLAPGNAGVNVIISPKTTLGLALAGPTWAAPGIFVRSMEIVPLLIGNL